MKDILLLALYVVFILAVAVATGTGLKYGLPWLKAKMAAVDWDNVVQLVTAGVYAAEARFKESGVGPTLKKPWVQALLQGAGVVVDSIVDALIDAKVKEMNDAKLLSTALAGMPDTPTEKQPDSVEATFEGKDTTQDQNAV